VNRENTIHSRDGTKKIPDQRSATGRRKVRKNSRDEAENPENHVVRTSFLLFYFFLTLEVYSK